MLDDKGSASAKARQRPVQRGTTAGQSHAGRLEYRNEREGSYAAFEPRVTVSGEKAFELTVFEFHPELENLIVGSASTQFESTLRINSITVYDADGEQSVFVHHEIEISGGIDKIKF